jgi:hypothetical protein
VERYNAFVEDVKRSAYLVAAAVVLVEVVTEFSSLFKRADSTATRANYRVSARRWNFLGTSGETKFQTHKNDEQKLQLTKKIHCLQDSCIKENNK